MTRSIEATTIGAFVLEVQLPSGLSYFAVKSFDLHKYKGQITSCDVLVSGISYLVQGVTNTTYPELSKVQTLYEYAMDPGIQPMKCRLLQFDSKDTRTRNGLQWFSGRLCVVSLSVSTTNGISSECKCSCLGKACQLFFSYVNDFKQTDAKQIQNIVFLQRNALIGPTSALTNFFRTQKLDLLTLIELSQQDVAKDTIDVLFSKAFSTLQKQRKRLTNLPDTTPDIDLADYLKSDYKLGQVMLALAQGIGTGSPNPYLKKFNQTFANGLNSTQIFDAVNNTLHSGSRMLSFIPSARQQTDEADLLHIIPDYVIPVTEQPASYIGPHMVAQANVSLRPVNSLSIPDVLYTNVSALTSFKCPASQISVMPGIYGRYKAPTAQNKAFLKLRQVAAPWWMLTMCEQKILKSTEKNHLKNTPVGKTPKQKDQDISPSNHKQLLLQSLNAYTKTVFFNMYAADKVATVTLLPFDDVLDLDHYIGYTTQIDLPLGQDDLNQNLDHEFYGVLQGLTYSYGCSSAPGQASYLTVRATVTALTPKESTYKDIFQTSSNSLLYRKV